MAADYFCDVLVDGQAFELEAFWLRATHALGAEPREITAAPMPNRAHAFQLIARAPANKAIRFQLSRQVVEAAHAIDGGAIECEVDGPGHILAHVIQTDVGGVEVMAWPVDIHLVKRLVGEVRELIDADDRNAASTCGVRDALAPLEAWLEPLTGGE